MDQPNSNRHRVQIANVLLQNVSGKFSFQNDAVRKIIIKSNPKVIDIERAFATTAITVEFIDLLLKVLRTIHTDYIRHSATSAQSNENNAKLAQQKLLSKVSGWRGNSI